MSQITARPASHTLASNQGPAITALSMLLAECSDLPPAYITMQPTARGGFGLQLDTPQDAEVWREALGIDPQTVSLRWHGGSVWTETAAEYRGVPVRVTGHGVPLSGETAKARQEVTAAEQVAA